jgi:hypothetical protein
MSPCMEVGFASASVKPFGAWFDSLCHAEHVAALSCPCDAVSMVAIDEPRRCSTTTDGRTAPANLRCRLTHHRVRLIERNMMVGLPPPEASLAVRIAGRIPLFPPSPASACMTTEPTCQRRAGGSVRGSSGAIEPAQERDLIFFLFLITDLYTSL